MRQFNQIRPTYSAGFTLVELLVGVALSLFIVSISLTYMVSSSRTFSAQTNDDIIQENARFTLEFLTQQFRLAGLNPRNELASELDLISNSTFCARDVTVGVAEGSFTNSGTSNRSCTKDNESPAAFRSVRFGFDYKVIAPTSTCGGQNITQTMLNNSGGVLTLTNVFFVADTTGRAGVRSLNCQTFDIESNQTIGPAVPIIDGVDAMQIQYGRDTNGDGVVDSYVNYTGLVNGVADRAVATRAVKLVRVAMLISSGLSTGANSSVSSTIEGAENKTYRLLDGVPFTVNNDRVLRQVFSTTILIPNALGE